MFRWTLWGLEQRMSFVWKGLIWRWNVSHGAAELFWPFWKIFRNKKRILCLSSFRWNRNEMPKVFWADGANESVSGRNHVLIWIGLSEFFLKPFVEFRGFFQKISDLSFPQSSSRVWLIAWATMRTSKSWFEKCDSRIPSSTRIRTQSRVSIDIRREAFVPFENRVIFESFPRSFATANGTLSLRLHWASFSDYCLGNFIKNRNFVRVWFANNKFMTIFQHFHPQNTAKCIKVTVSFVRLYLNYVL